MFIINSSNKSRLTYTDIGIQFNMSTTIKTDIVIVFMKRVNA